MAITRKDFLVVCVAFVLVMGLCVVLTLDRPIETTTEDPTLENPKFIISSWNFPDSYGQGIDGLQFYENSSGSWVIHQYIWSDGNPYYFLNYYQDNYDLNWTAEVCMKLRVYSIINKTLTGASDVNDGKNYHKHNVTVQNHLGTEVFSQQNFTYYDGGEVADVIGYEYEVVLNFIPRYGGIYEITIFYEVYYQE